MTRYYVNKAGRGGTTPWLVWRSVDGTEWNMAIHHGFESWRHAMSYAFICVKADRINRQSSMTKLEINSRFGKRSM